MSYYRRDILGKICVLGDARIGKSAFLHRYTTGTFCGLDPELNAAAAGEATAKEAERIRNGSPAAATDSKTGKPINKSGTVYGIRSGHSSATIGADFQSVKIPNINDYSGRARTVQLQIWDTAGQERFHALSGIYFRGADGIMICFSLTDRISYENVRAWRSFVDETTGGMDETVPFFLVGLQSDRGTSESLCSVCCM